jgi:DNA primase
MWALARRFAPKVIAFFDGDRAGQEAAARAFAVCVEAGVWGLGAFLPDGVDPDDYVRQHGAAATLALLEGATPLADFFIGRLDPGPNAGLPERARAAERIGQVISRVRDPFQFNLLAKQSAQRLGVDESVFRELRVAGPTRLPAGSAVDRAESAVSFRPEEATLLEAMALDREVATLVSDRGVLDGFSSSALADAGRALIAAWKRGDAGNAAIDQLPPAIAERVTAGLLGEGPIATGDRLQAARDCIGRIERRARRSQAREISATLRQAEAAGDDRRYSEALARKNEFLRQKRTDNG